MLFKNLKGVSDKYSFTFRLKGITIDVAIVGRANTIQDQ